jgi:predicted SAM-dependent methyltransferase
MKTTKPVKLHLGCGTNVVKGKGWLNVDNDPAYKIKDKNVYLKWDLRKPLPYKPNTVDQIFHEHFIEHLPKSKGEAFLKDCYKVLKPGGTMRIGWPDTTNLMRAYVTRNKEYFNYIATNVNLGSVPTTWDELVVDFFYSWDHKYGYTRKHLKKVLLDIGFKKAKFKKYKQSDYGYDIDFRNDPATTFIEVVK